jgi:bifunctional non-homologous end joining protein LigD
MGLAEYNKKRKFARTPEPLGIMTRKKKIQLKKRAFVVQKHRATRLHYDLRLEDEFGALKSWAVPKGPSLDPQVKRLAVSVEDHPYDYLLFEGTIPKGNYGAGTVIVWDHGTYDSERKLVDQFKDGKISFELNGKKLKGHFSLVRTSREGQWLLIKANDEFAMPDFDLTNSKPESVLSGRTNDDLEGSLQGTTELNGRKRKNIPDIQNKGQKGKKISSQTNEMLPKLRPMLAYPADEAFDSGDWVFEIKWDGVRAITYIHNNSIRIESRKGNTITKKYPDIYKALEHMEVAKHSVVLDGEIVVLGEKGIPDFQGHQHRMNISNIQEIEAMAEKIPATYYVFDILFLDGKDLRSIPFLDRRKLLAKILVQNSCVKISDYIENNGSQMLKHTIEFNLEGIIAKRKSSQYHEGVRSHEWLKIKNTRTQDCVIIGYTKGEGNRSKGFGSLLLAVYDTDSREYKFIGHAGTGFDFQAVREIYAKLQTIRAEHQPVKSIPYKNRETVWVKPVLVAEVKFVDWTEEGIMRAPVFMRFRVDKSPEECVIEADQPNAEASAVKAKIESEEPSPFTSNKNRKEAKTRSHFSNLYKIYWPATHNVKQITKGDLINYYDLVSTLILPHLRDRPLSLSRYPNGINGKSFYHKDWDQSRPDYVKTAKVYSEHRNDPINYLVCNNVETLLWIANLGSIEMHPWYSRIRDFERCKTSTTLYEIKCGLNFPDFIVLDLDPYIYSGKEKAGSEPEYNFRGFRAAAEVAFDLKDVLDELKIKSYVKTSGKTGLHIYIPTIPKFSYDKTRSFAELVGKILISKFPNKITMEWSTAKRKGKVFFDYNQNSRGKTIASAWSVRPTPSATVSVPIDWGTLDDINPLEYNLGTVPPLFKSKPDPWKGILNDKQDLSKIMAAVRELAR